MSAPELFGIAWVRSSAGMGEHFASDGNSGQDQPRFVGYQTQRDQAERCFQEVLGGAARVLLINGDEGIGKTRFLQQIQTTAAYWGMQVCAGRCHAEVALPLAPFVESLLLHIEEGLTDASPSLHLDVEMVRRFRHRDRSIVLDLSDATSGQANLDKLHLFLALSRAAVALARHCPTLIVVDDLHWADPLSLELFAHLAFTLADLSVHESIPLCLVGAHRPVAAATRLGSLLSRFQRERIFRTLELTGFDEPESIAFVATLGVGHPSHQLVTMIREIAQGNPFVMQAVVHALAQQHALRDRGGDLVAASLQHLKLPRHVTGDITDRIQGLRPELQQVLILAALIGYRFSPYLLSAVSGHSEESLLSLLEEGEQQQLLLSEDDDFQFAHPLIRHAFSTTPNARQRQRLHQQIAQALEELYADDMEAHLCDIAYHFIRAGSMANMDIVSDYARRAAENAARRCSWTDAARYYEAALTAAQARGHLAPHTRAELHYQAGQAHQRAMDVGPCLDHYNHAIEAYQQTDHIQGVVRTRIEKTRVSCTIAFVSDSVHIDVQPLKDALAALAEDHLSLQGAIAASIAEAYWTANQIEQAKTMAAQALHIGVNSQDVRLCAQASHVLALTHVNTGHVQKALEYWRQALSWVQQVPDVWLQGLPLSHIALALHMLGRLDEAQTITQEAVALTQSTQDWRNYAVALSNLIALHVVQGDFVAAERHARNTWLMASCSHLSGPSSHALCTMACAHMLRGAWTAAEQCLAMQLEPGRMFEASGSALELGVPLLLNLIQGYAGKGFESDADVCAVAVAQTADVHLLPLRCAVAEMGYLMSDPQVGAQVYTALHHAMDQGMIFTQGWIFLIPRVLGLIATLNQWWEQADRHFQVALEVATRVNAQPELGRTYLDYALMLEARGHADDLDHVQQFAGQARTIFTHLGMVPFLQRVDELLLRLQPSTPDAQQELHPVYTNSRGERVSSIVNRVSQTRTQFLA
jgi:tetratricopeptide (TPR) repeat protein